MSDKEIRRCHYCGSEVAWIWSGHRLKDGSKIYCDSEDRRWAGRRCPDCERRRVVSAVKCTGFKRDHVLRELEAQGYAVLSRGTPIMVSKDGRKFSVEIQSAVTRGDKILLEERRGEADIYALVFESVRFCTADQIQKLDGKLEYFEKRPTRSGKSEESRTDLHG